MKLEVGKKYVARDGKGVGRVLSDNLDNSNFPVVVALSNKHNNDGEIVRLYRKDGRFSLVCEHPGDLVAEYVEPLTRDIWLNVYKDSVYGLHLVNQCSSKKEADKWAGEDRVARIKLTLTEGQFDD